MVFEQDSFVGGINLMLPDVAVATNAYCLTVNARTRYGYVEPITQPLLITGATNGLPVGTVQGIVTVGNSVIAFISGLAYYKLYTSSQWVQVPNFEMDNVAPLIYTQAVPASSLNYTRLLNTSTLITDPILRQANGRVAGFPSGIVCQDGITQPFYVTFNEITEVWSARQLNDYSEWTIGNPEYVPIGTIMMYINDKLYITSPDGSQLFQSCTGQPLNFVVNITTTGAAGGDATTTSFAFDYDPITCLYPSATPNSFLYGTASTIRIITLDYTNELFGEPTYDLASIINAGIINQYGIAPINGDYGFIDYEGIRSFNAVLQLQFEGKNSVFSKSVSKFFKGVYQTAGVAFEYDNYTFFSVNTTCGSILLIYDTISQVWIGADNFGIGNIIQAAIIDLEEEQVLYVATDQNQIYQLYSSQTETAIPALLTRAFSTIGVNQYYAGVNVFANVSAPVTDIKSQKVDLIFKNGSFDGTVQVAEFVDGTQKLLLSKPIVEANDVVTNTIIPSFQPVIEPPGGRTTFNFDKTPKGYKLGYLISWNNDAVLMKVRVVTTDYTRETSDSQKQQVLSTIQT